MELFQPQVSQMLSLILGVQGLCAFFFSQLEVLVGAEFALDGHSQLSVGLNRKIRRKTNATQ